MHTRVAYRFLTSLKKMMDDKGFLFLLTFINDDTCDASALKHLMKYALRITIETWWHRLNQRRVRRESERRGLHGVPHLERLKHPELRNPDAVF